MAMTGDDYDPIRKPFENPSVRKNILLPGGGIAFQVTESQAKLLQARQKFVENYCCEKGWDILNLSIDQLMEVRNQPGWQNPS